MASDEELGTLARERGPALVAYAYLLTGDLSAAQDLVQDALVKTFSRRRSGTEVEWLEAYVRRTILNVYLDGYRRSRRWAARMHLVVDQAPGYGPADDVAAARADVHAALGALSPRERACIVLRHYEDLTVPEIARRLGLQEGSVKRYLADARGRLGPLLAPGGSTHDGDLDTHTHIQVTTTEESGR
jgi:RNA polymerase sigma factor (sigma-70 family)